MNTNNCPSIPNSVHFRRCPHHYPHRSCHTLGNTHRPANDPIHHGGPCHPVRQSPSVIDRFLQIDTSLLEDIFPFSLVPSLKHLIDATWRCFQLRYQLFPIRFPGGECDEEEVNHSCQQERPQNSRICRHNHHRIPPSVDLHRFYENSTPPTHMFMQNSSNPERSTCGQRSLLTRTSCSAINCSCHCCCCSCCCCSQCNGRTAPRCRPFISRVRPCPQHISLLDSLEDDSCCSSPHVCTKAEASSLNLRIRLLASCSSDCTSIEGPRKDNCRKSSAIQESTQSSKATHAAPTCLSEATSVMAAQSHCNTTTSALICEGVDLLKEGARLIETNQELAPTTAIEALQETALKLKEAIEGQLALLREENEVLRATNNILRSQITANQIEQSNKAKVDGQQTEGTSTEEPKLTILHDTKDTATQKSETEVTGNPTTATTTVPSDTSTVLPTYKTLECLDERITYLECRVENLEKSNQCQSQLIANLQEKLHRQEIRYHDTITKFDETCRSMKVMFDGLKSAVNAAANNTNEQSK